MGSKYIIGIGNDLMGDDAIGLRVIDHIDSLILNADYETVRLGNAILNLVSYLNSSDNKILIVDCAYLGLNPGEYRIFDNLDSFLLESSSKTSTHGASLCQVVNLVRNFSGNNSKPQIHVLAIQPEYVESVYGVSEILCNRLSDYSHAAINEICREWR